MQNVKEKIVYKTKYYTVKRNSEWVIPRYMIYNNESVEVIKIAKSQAEATMWIKRQQKNRLIGIQKNQLTMYTKCSRIEEK